MLLAAVFAGRSYQPNLLTRGTVDQAVLTGVSAASGYGAATVVQSLLSWKARMLAGGTERAGVEVGVDAAAVATGSALLAAVPWQEDQSRTRAGIRLLAGTVAATGAAGLVASGVGAVARGEQETAVVLGTTSAVGVGAWLATRPRRQKPASNYSPGKFLEDRNKEVSSVKAGVIGVGVLAASFLLARGESVLTRTLARGSAKVLGGHPSNYSMIGRLGAAAATTAVGLSALSAVSGRLTQGGEGMEPAHAEPPESSTVTGGPDSTIAWSALSRAGRRWLGMTLTPAGIDAVMGTEDAVQPIRLYSSLEAADSPDDRVRKLLAEIDRTKALERPVFALFSPTGTGYVNYAACETLEYLTGGDCASVAIQYSVLPSSLSLGKVGTGVEQTRMLIQAIKSRIDAMPAERRPLFYLFGESLGSQVSQETLRNTGTLGLELSGIDRAIWIGTPFATEWRREVWGPRSLADAPAVGPDTIYLPRALPDLFALPESERSKVRYLLLQNGDDPIPKFGVDLLLGKPAWLGADANRPPNSPQGTTWMPVTTFLATFIDMLNALTPVPGIFTEGGHDYRLVLPFAMREFWDLPATEEQMDRIVWALRLRELAWNVYRKWKAAEAAPEEKQAAKKRKVLDLASAWLGRSVTEEELPALFAEGLQPKPAAGSLASAFVTSTAVPIDVSHRFSAPQSEAAGQADSRNEK